MPHDDFLIPELLPPSEDGVFKTLLTHADAKLILQTISTNEDERARFRARRKFRMDMEHNIIAAQDERAMIIAWNLMKMGLPIEQIVTATELTYEEIEHLHDISKNK